MLVINPQSPVRYLPSVDPGVIANAAQPTRVVIDAQEEFADLAARRPLIPTPLRQSQTATVIQSKNAAAPALAVEQRPSAESSRADTLRIFKRYMMLTFGLSVTASLVEQINRYLQEQGSLDFSQDQPLIDALGKGLNIYGSNAGEADAAPSWRQDLSDRLLLALLGDVDFSTLRNDFSFSQLRGQPLAQARDVVLRKVRDVLLQSLPLDTEDADDVALSLARRLAPIVLPEPSLYLEGVPDDVFYGDRQWGDLMVGMKVAQASDLDLAVLSPTALIALGQQALKDALSTSAVDSTEMSLSQYKALVMGVAQGKIKLKPSGAETPSAESLAAQIESFYAEEYYYELKTVESLADLAAMPFRRQMAGDILRANNIEVEKDIKLNYRGPRITGDFYRLRRAHDCLRGV